MAINVLLRIVHFLEREHRFESRYEACMSGDCTSHDYIPELAIRLKLWEGLYAIWSGIRFPSASMKPLSAYLRGVKPVAYTLQAINIVYEMHADSCIRVTRDYISIGCLEGRYQVFKSIRSHQGLVPTEQTQLFQRIYSKISFRSY